MIFRTRSFALATLATLALFIPSSASAGPIWTIDSDAKGGVGQLETLTWAFNGTSETGLAGTITTHQVPGGTPFDTYCVDLYHYFTVGGGGTTWQAELLPITSFAGDAGVPQGDATGGNGGAIGYLYNTYAAGVTTAIEGAALQIAIWKVDYDDSNNFSTGSFQFAATSDPNSIQSQVFAQATTYLAGFNGTQSSDNAILFRATTHPDGQYQDLVGPASVDPSIVPEPSSIMMVVVGLGLGAVAQARRARRVARQPA